MIFKLVYTSKQGLDNEINNKQLSNIIYTYTAVWKMSFTNF